MSNQVDTQDAMIIEKKLFSDSSDKEITEYLKCKLGHIIYVPENDQWFIYDGKIYKETHKKRLQSEALKVLYGIDNGRKATKQKASQIVDHLELISQIDEGREINDKRDYLILDNCIMNINSFDLMPHIPQIYNTNLIDIPIKKDDVKKIKDDQFNALDNAPIFKKFLNDTFFSDYYKEQEKTIDLVQEMMGYCLTSHTKAQKAFFLKGDGQDGKSVICDVIEGLVGKKNTTEMSFESFGKEFYGATVIGKTASISRESKRIRFKEDVNTGKFKAFVGGDSTQINIKNKPPQSVKPFCKFIFAVNHYPEVPDDSHGFARRVVNVPFRRRVPQNEINTNLANDILEKEFKQVFLFALQGLYRLSKNNYRFDFSIDIKEETEKYLNVIDPVQDFINKKLVFNEHAKIKTQRIEFMYQEYTEMNNVSGDIRLRPLLRAIIEKNTKYKIEKKRLKIEDDRSYYLVGVGEKP